MESNSIPKAEDYFESKEKYFDNASVNADKEMLISMLDEFAYISLQHGRKEWEKEKEAYAVDQVAKAIQTMSNKRY